MKNATDYIMNMLCETFTNWAKSNFCLPALNELNWCYMPLCPASCIAFFRRSFEHPRECTHCNVCKAQIFQPLVSQIYICPPKQSNRRCLPKKVPAQFKLGLESVLTVIWLNFTRQCLNTLWSALCVNAFFELESHAVWMWYM